MISVNIATLKAKLSAYLGQVKAGHEIVVMDRNTPVARIVPSVGIRKGLTIRKPTKNPADLKGMKFRPVRLKIDVVSLLREDRDRR